MGEPSEIVLPLGGILDITGEVVMMWLIILILSAISVIVTRSLKERPGTFQNVIETGVEYLDNFFTGIIGKSLARKYFYFLGSLFVFIIVGNYSGLFPGVGLSKYFKAPTATLSTTLGLGVVTFVFLQASSIKVRGFKGYLKSFVSPIAVMLPLLLLDEFIKPASLALRLFGNVFGEETVTEELYGLLPIGAPIIMMALSLLFCAIQAVVFTMLVSIYLDEAVEITE